MKMAVAGTRERYGEEEEEDEDEDEDEQHTPSRPRTYAGSNGPSRDTGEVWGGGGRGGG